MGIQSTLRAGAVRNDNKLMDVQSFTSNETLTEADSGKIINNQGAAGAVTLTLPAQAAGLNFIVSNVENQDLIVSADTIDTIACFNDVAADQIALNTASEKVGGAFFVYADGTNWVAHEMVHDGQTAAIAT